MNKINQGNAQLMSLVLVLGLAMMAAPRGIEMMAQQQSERVWDVTASQFNTVQMAARQYISDNIDTLATQVKPADAAGRVSLPAVARWRSAVSPVRHSGTGTAGLSAPGSRLHRARHWRTASRVRFRARRASYQLSRASRTGAADCHRGAE